MIYTRLSADASAAALAAKVIAQEPFLHVRYGDGALECMAGRAGRTRDLEEYSPELRAALAESWAAIGGDRRVYVGDWQSASFDEQSEHARYAEQYAALAEAARGVNWIHFEALLLMRESRKLVDFYAAVRRDPRRKLFMGPAWNAGAATLLRASYLVTPMRPDLLRYFEAVPGKLWDCQFDVLLYGSGMAGQVQAIECWKRHPERTYINLGSAMDPLFRGMTRRQQIHPVRARQLFEELLAA